MTLPWKHSWWSSILPVYCLALLPSPSQQSPNSDWPQWIEQVRRQALQYTERLPDFICTQITRRYIAESGDVDWRALDSWEAELSFVSQKERYAGIKLNGKPTSKNFESLGGMMSIGEFGSALRTLFLSETHAQFQKEGEAELEGVFSVVSRFRVDQANSNWTLSVRTSHSLNVGFYGKIWIDPRNKQILKITQQTNPLPATFPILSSQLTTEYSYFEIPGAKDNPVLLPRRANLVIQERNPAVRSRNIIEFRNYRRFSADVRLVPH